MGQSPWHPKRLIDVGIAETCSPMLRIITRDKINDKEDYVTLSHCWGKADFLQLTSDNLSDLENGFEEKSLPLTFQDTIYVVRQLGKRYLWIDSLCVIQKGDRGLDWTHQAPLMHEIYSRSICTISAVAAVDSSNILFSPRIPGSHHRTELDLHIDGIDSSQHTPKWTLSDVKLMWGEEL